MFPQAKPSVEFFAQEVMTQRPEQLGVSAFVNLTNIVAQELERLGYSEATGIKRGTQS